MAEYVISAVLKAKDNGLTAGLKAARKESEKLERGIGELKKDSSLNMRMDIDGLAKIERLKGAIEAAGMKSAKPINIKARDDVTSKLQKIRSELSSLTSKPWQVIVNVKNNAKESLGKIKGGISEGVSGAAMAAGAGVTGVAGIGYGAVDMINTYKDFDYQMRRNKALFTTGMDADVAEAQYKELMAAARKYGSTMIFTNAEVAKAEEYMALAGWDAQTAINALPAVLNAAVASGEDLALVSDIITDDMTAMGYKAGTYVKNAMGENVEAAQHFADVMLRTTLRSNTNFQQLGLAMKYAAPLAHTLGYNIEEVAVAMGLMANNGIKADQAGTGLRGILNRLIKPPKQAAMALDQLGISLFDAQGEAKSLMPLMMDIRAALNGKDVDSMLDFAEAMSGEQYENREELTDFLKEAKERGGGKLSARDQARLGSMLSGTYALSAFMAIMNSSDEDIQKLMTEIYQKSDGTGAEIQKEMMDTLQGDLKTIQSAWEDLSFELMSGKGANGLREFLQSATEDINTFKNSLKDGFDFSDVINIVIKIIGQLKNKFLELDGIGSILAGGALMMGMKQILSMGLKVKDTLAEWSRIKTASDLGAKIRGQSLSQSAGGLSKIGAMNISAGVVNIKAGVVNLSGAIKGGQPTSATSTSSKATTVATTASSRTTTAATSTSSRTTTAATSTSSKAATTSSPQVLSTVEQRAQRYERERIAGQQRAWEAERAAQAANRQAMMSGMKSAGALSAIFAAFDVFSAKSQSEYSMNEAKSALAFEKQELESLRSQGADVSQINSQLEKIQQAQDNVKSVAEMNAVNERHAEAGALGSVIGAALGSIVPGLGTAIGGVIGGIAGNYLGVKVSDMYANQQASMNGGKVITSEGYEVDAADPLIKYSAGIRRRHNIDSGSAVSEKSSVKNIEQTQSAGVQSLSAAEVDHSLISNAEHISRRNQQERLESQGVRIIDNDSKLEQARQEMRVQRQQETTMHELQEKYSAAQTERASREFTSLASVTGGFSGRMSRVQNYDTDVSAEVERDQNQALAEWNRQSQLQASVKKMQEWHKFWGDAGQWLTKHTPDNQGYAPAESPKIAGMPELDTSKRSEIFGSAVDFLDGLIFSKAAASSLTTEGVTRTSEGVQEVQAQAPLTQTQTPAPMSAQAPIEAAASSTFELPNLKEIFSGFEMPELNIGEKISSEIESISTLASTAWDNFKTSAASNFDEVSSSFSNVFDGVKNSAASSFDEISSSLSNSFDNIKTSITSNAEGFSSAFSTAFDGAKTTTLTLFTGIAELISNSLNEAKTTALTHFSDIAESFSTGFESIKTTALSSFDEISTSLGSGFEILKTSAMSGVEEFATAFSTGFDTIKISASTIFEEIAVSMSSGLESMQMAVVSSIEGMSASFSSGFETIQTTAATVFSSLSAIVSEGVSAASTMITSTFTSAAAEVQGIWGAIPGFFSGVFGGLGGIAAAAGSAIAAGVNSGIGMIQSAWEGLSGWLSAKISSLASMAANAAATIGIGVGSNYKGTSNWRGGFTEVNEHGGELIILPNGDTIAPYRTTQNLFDENRIAHNYKGTSFFEGGWSEVNEHGGELMYLPKGTQIIPHATTVRILRSEIREKLRNDSRDAAENNFFDKNSQTGLELFASKSVAGNSLRVSLQRSDSLSESAPNLDSSFNKLDIAHNYGGTNDFKGGLSTVNEHGGELIILPDGRQITPLSTAQSLYSRAFQSAHSASNQSSAGGVQNQSANILQKTRADGILSILRNRPNANGRAAAFSSTASSVAVSNGDGINSDFKNYRTDNLGNVIGLDVLKDNVITSNDSVSGQRAKREAQYWAYLNRQSNFQSMTARQNNLQQSQTANSIAANSNFEGVTNTSSASNTLRTPPPIKTTQPSIVSNRRSEGFSLWNFISSIFNNGRRPKYSDLSVPSVIATSTRGNIYNGELNFPKIITRGDIYRDKTNGEILNSSQISGDKSVVSTKNRASNGIIGGIINIWRHSKRGVNFNAQDIFNPIMHYSQAAGNLFGGLTTSKNISNANVRTTALQRQKHNLKSTIRQSNVNNSLKNIEGLSIPEISGAASGNLPAINEIGGDTFNQLGQLDSLKPLTLDNLPVPARNMPSNNSNTETKNSNNHVNINFGGVNINNGADFDEFTYKIMTLLNQSASNSVMN